MEDRCAGSLRRPAVVAPGARRPWTRTLGEQREPVPVALGACGVCGAWLRVLANGTLPVHVNWRRRQARTTGPTG
jgi:hypothetical protein